MRDLKSGCIVLCANNGTRLAKNMKSPNPAKLHKQAVRSLSILLVTALALLVWLVGDVGAIGILDAKSGTISVNIGRHEFLLVMILLLLNVMMTYALMRHMSPGGRATRASLATILASMLSLCLWIGIHVLPRGVSDGVESAVSMDLGRAETWFALALVLLSILGILLLMRRFGRAKELVVISAYSKKVRYHDEWISIEEYLERELGIAVSHGITPDERDKVMEDFRKEREEKGIPRPSDE